MNWNEYPDALKVVPGALGSLFSLLWIKDSWFRMGIMLLGGIAAAYYATPYVSHVTGLDAGLSGFLLGLFAMSLVASLVIGWQKVDLGTIIRDSIRQLLRLPPKDA